MCLVTDDNRHMRWCLVLVLGVGACGSVTAPLTDAHVGDGSGTTDGRSIDAPPPCDVTRPFDPPVTVAGINTSANEENAWLSSDELTIYFTRTAVNSVDSNIYRATRSQPSGTFSNVVPLSGINTTGEQNRAVLSGDGLTLYVQTAGNTTASDISMSTRTSTAAEFVGLSPVSGLSTTKQEFTEWISDDGLTAYFGSNPTTGPYDIYIATRSSVATGFGAASPVTGIDSDTSDEYSPVLSKDGLEMFFVSTRDNSNSEDIWHAVRSSLTASWDAPTRVTELSTSVSGINDAPNWLSPDRCTIIFTSPRAGGDGGGYDIWIAKRP